MSVSFDRLNDGLEITSSQVLEKSGGSLYDLPMIPDSEICEESTHYIHDITSWEDEGKSIIFDAIRGVHRTNLSTRSLINKFLQDKPIEAMINRILGDQSNISQTVPLIIGQVGLVPLSGISRSSTHWVAAHHLLDLHFDPEDPQNTIIKFKGYQIHVPIKCGTLQSKLQQTIKIRQSLHLILEGLSETVGILDKEQIKKNNFKIDNRVKNVMLPFKLPQDALIDFLTRLHLLFCETLYEECELDFENIRAQVNTGLGTISRMF